MSIVSEVSLERAKDLRKSALGTTNWQLAYEYAIRGLELSIATLEQIKQTTSDVKIETTISLSKD